MNNKEIMCARSLARAFCYGEKKSFAPYLPPYSEVIEVAKKVIHEEATCPAKMVRKSKKTPLKPKGGYSCEGAYVFLDPFDDKRGDIYECLRTSLLVTYDEYERRKDDVIKKKKMTEHEKAVKALSDAFRKGIISGIEKYGSSYKAYYTDEEIQKEADFVLNEEQSDESIRWVAGTILHEKTKVEIPYPYTNKCPVYLPEYSAIGGELFIKHPRMRLYDALHASARESYVEWFMENYQKVIEMYLTKQKANGRNPDAV